MSIHEIVLPDTKPETEWILGRAVRKVSPFRTHALLQSAFSAALLQWSAGGGAVGTEWRFRVAPPGEIRRPLVPDIAFVRYERLAGLEGRELEAPEFSPDVAIEIRSPGDRVQRIEHKIGVYLATGAELVIVVDPAGRTVRLHDADGTRELGRDDVIAHPALPGFSLALPELFKAADPPR
jgi:Uma2 family endonuclease